ncbi:hypothetical protein M413DRAFT_437842 [Hebeloma cylindrosporum]|uniref:Uncharacterized protein n=1 Tax=Hebeloma cylindrosporum TaxID=76867 RepID=A0A0C3CJ08_HEBCY|nr:hypothetical protein M413DRAFT_437842 [Hebeloma cylindrosporum h7]
MGDNVNTTREETVERRKRYSKAPGDPASSPLDQREEQSAKIVFENTLSEKSPSPTFVWTILPFAGAC